MQNMQNLSLINQSLSDFKWLKSKTPASVGVYFFLFTKIISKCTTKKAKPTLLINPADFAQRHQFSIIEFKDQISGVLRGTALSYFFPYQIIALEHFPFIHHIGKNPLKFFL